MGRPSAGLLWAVVSEVSMSLHAPASAAACKAMHPSVFDGHCSAAKYKAAKPFPSAGRGSCVQKLCTRSREPASTAAGAAVELCEAWQDLRHSVELVCSCRLLHGAWRCQLPQAPAV